MDNLLFEIFITHAYKDKYHRNFRLRMRQVCKSWEKLINTHINISIRICDNITGEMIDNIFDKMAANNVICSDDKHHKCSYMYYEKFKNIKSLRMLSRLRICDVSRFTNLTELELFTWKSRCYVGDILKLHQLEKLKLYKCKNPDTMNNFDKLSELPNLTELHLEKTDIYCIHKMSNLLNLTVAYQHIHGLESLVNLTKLDLCRTDFEFEDFGVFPNLTDLTIKSYDDDDCEEYEGTANPILQLNNLTTNLRRLTLDCIDVEYLELNNDITNLEIRNCYAFPVNMYELMNLRKLHISMYDYHIQLPSLTNLTSLKLEFCYDYYTDLGDADLLRNLRKLSVSHSKVYINYDNDVFTNLTSLNVDYSKTNIIDFSCYPNLTYLNMCGFRDFDEESLYTLSNLEIIRYDLRDNYEVFMLPALKLVNDKFIS